ncbi:HAD family hydrolase [Actinomadura litoris]|uniref:HAD family hydrolase n=1 Tax=Actinomadura litoris TaxID=2678616 RepID=UPI001FA7BC57|nr:HAD family phosphatase [Actinomadura litoris]
MPVQAIVFDLDGVLIDSEPMWEDVRRGYVSARGGRWLPDTQDRLMGMSTPEWADYIATDLVEGVTADEVAYEVIDQMSQRYADGPPLLPGAREAVQRMAEYRPLGLASSSPRALIDLALGKLGLEALFRATVSTEEVDRGKPEPDGYLTVAARLEVPAGACVAIEDSANGLRSAHAAGMAVIAVPREAHPPAPEALDLAAHTVRHLDEITPELVGRLGS